MTCMSAMLVATQTKASHNDTHTQIQKLRHTNKPRGKKRKIINMTQKSAEHNALQTLQKLRWVHRVLSLRSLRVYFKCVLLNLYCSEA